MNTAHLFLVAFILFLSYRLSLVIYNLYLHPLAKFPGPKLAAISYLPETYYNLFVGEGGQFPLAIREWHDRYGPIIRINPNELHVRDSAWFDTLYDSSKPAYKHPDHLRRFGTELAAGGTADPTLWRIRRMALNPFFSRRRIAQDLPRFVKNVEKALRIVQEDYVESGKTLCLNGMWSCYAGDNIIEMCFGGEANMLDSPEFLCPAVEAMESMSEGTHVFYQFPDLMGLMLKIPLQVVLWLDPSMKPLLAFKESVNRTISKVLTEHASGAGKTDNDKTIFSSLLHQDLPPEEVTLERLSQEAQTMVGAGVETVARTLAIACFHIIDQSRIRERLMAELSLISEEASKNWDDLAKLPYLSACIEEACRLTYGIGQRRPRAFDSPLQYKEWTIPPRAFVGMVNWDVSHDESIFPDSFSFVPERWLGEPLAPDGRPLRVYQVSFGKGTRNCIGMQFAYAQMYIGLAKFMRSRVAKRAVLYETDKSDVEMARDYFLPRPSRASKGVRVVFR